MQKMHMCNTCMTHVQKTTKRNYLQILKCIHNVDSTSKSGLLVVLKFADNDHGKESLTCCDVGHDYHVIFHKKYHLRWR